VAVPPLPPQKMSQTEFIRTWALGAAQRAFGEIVETDFGAADIPELVDWALAKELPWSRIEGIVGSMAATKLGEHLVCVSTARLGTDIASLTAPGEDVVFRVPANAAAVETFKREWRDALSYARTWLQEGLVDWLSESADDHEEVHVDESDDELSSLLDDTDLVEPREQ